MMGLKFDIRRLCDVERAALLRRLRIVKDMERITSNARRAGFTIGAAVDEYVRLLRAAGINASRSTLYGWRKRYRASQEGIVNGCVDCLDGITGLMDGRTARAFKRRGWTYEWSADKGCSTSR